MSRIAQISLGVAVSLSIGCGTSVETWCPEGTSLSDQTCVANSVEARCEQDCEAAGKVCADSGVCVDCVDNSQCSSANPVCGSSGVCGPCESDADCVDSVCVVDETDASFGACVECTAETAPARCPGRACVISAHACSSNDAASRGLCEVCEATGDCPADHACVLTTFRGAGEVAPRCLPLAPAGGAPCALIPRGARQLRAESTEGFSVDVCGLNPVVTNCDAYLAVANNEVCPPTGANTCLDGAACSSIGRCRLACSGAEDCHTEAQPGVCTFNPMALPPSLLCVND